MRCWLVSDKTHLLRPHYWRVLPSFLLGLIGLWQLFNLHFFIWCGFISDLFDPVHKFDCCLMVSFPSLVYFVCFLVVHGGSRGKAGTWLFEFESPFPVPSWSHSCLTRSISLLFSALRLCQTEGGALVLVVRFFLYLLAGLMLMLTLQNLCWI